MMTGLFTFLSSILQSAWSMLNSSSTWVVFSFIVAGLLHEFIKPENMQKTAIGSKRITGILGTTISGMFLPICSCGTIPLGISLYYSGAYLGPTLAFMTSTPMINPITGKRNYNYICNYRIHSTVPDRCNSESFCRG